MVVLYLRSAVQEQQQQYMRYHMFPAGMRYVLLLLLDNSAIMLSYTNFPRVDDVLQYKKRAT